MLFLELTFPKDSDIGFVKSSVSSSQKWPGLNWSIDCAFDGTDTDIISDRLRSACLGLQLEL